MVYNLALNAAENRLAYTSMMPIVQMTDLDPETLEVGQTRMLALSNEPVALFCIQFSGNDKEIVAGGSDACIYIYDLEAKRTVEVIDAHEGSFVKFILDDVNSVCFVNPGDSNVVVSASDDSTLKVWDRRCIKQGVPSGILLGHTEGLTYVSPKGDGRYLLSNAKDQSMKLWDIRNMKSGQPDNSKSYRLHGIRHWDYRWEPYPLREPAIHPDDCSVKTFRGHSVLRTLIRCYFSPVYSTGQRYAYTGSADGVVKVFDLIGDDDYQIETDGLVRDLAWHPYDPMMVLGCCEPNKTVVVEADIGTGDEVVNAKKMPEFAMEFEYGDTETGSDGDDYSLGS